MPESTQADRRSFLTWSAGGALTGLARQASADTAAAPAPDSSGSSSLERHQDTHMQTPKALINHTFTDNVIMLAELTVKQDRLDEFLNYTVENLVLSRSYPGNLAFDILFNEAEPTKVTFYEAWKSVAAQKAYMSWRIQAGDLTKLLSFLTSEPKFTALRSIAT